MSIATLGIALISLLILALNRTEHGDEVRVAGLTALIGVGMLVAAGFTPAALAYLAELSERFPAKRGSLMGLYSVLLGGGQLLGGWLGGFFAHGWAVDGLVLLTALLGGAAMVGLFIISRIPEPEPGLHPVAAGAGSSHPHG